MNAYVDQEQLLAATVDHLAAVKAQIEQLRQEEESLKQVLIATEQPLVLGKSYRAAISLVSGRETTDWKGIAVKLGASRQIITANTKTGDDYYVVRLSAHKGTVG